MNHELRAKLRSALEAPITSERDAMYILVQVRRLMDVNQAGKTYESLKFHCDWAVHAQLTGPYAQAIVRMFDQYQGNLEQMGRRLTQDWSFLKRLGPMISLGGFRKELSAYLRSQRLPFTISDRDKEWAEFVSYYSQIVAECPLKCISQGMRSARRTTTSAASIPLKHTDEVTFGILEVRPETDESPMRVFVEWKCKSKLTGEEWTYPQSY